jgi:hypothetical protein
MSNKITYDAAGGEITLWIDSDGPMHMKVNSKFGDPVELNADEARELAQLLLKLADKID